MRLTHFYGCLWLGVVTVWVCGCAAEDDTMSWDHTLAWVRSDFPEVRQLSTEELAVWQADPRRRPPLLLDVRTEEEFEVSHLPGAVPAHTGEMISFMTRGLSRDTPIVLYCSVGYRSSQAALDLQDVGFQRVYNLEGSIFVWANEGRPVVRGDRPVSTVHPFDAEWGVLLDSRYHPR